MDVDMDIDLGPLDDIDIDPPVSSSKVSLPPHKHLDLMDL